MVKSKRNYKLETAMDIVATLIQNGRADAAKIVAESFKATTGREHVSKQEIAKPSPVTKEQVMAMAESDRVKLASYKKSNGLSTFKEVAISEINDNMYKLVCKSEESDGTVKETVKERLVISPNKAVQPVTRQVVHQL